MSNRDDRATRTRNQRQAAVQAAIAKAALNLVAISALAWAAERFHSRAQAIEVLDRGYARVAERLRGELRAAQGEIG